MDIGELGQRHSAEIARQNPTINPDGSSKHPTTRHAPRSGAPRPNASASLPMRVLRQEAPDGIEVHPLEVVVKIKGRGHTVGARRTKRTRLATLTPSSGSSVKHADPLGAVGDHALAGQLSAGRVNSSRIEGNAASRKPADWYMPAPSGVALRWMTHTRVSVSNQVISAVRHARP